jgi:ribosome-binding protein aMBF1 (putative translation factor)
MTKDESRGTSHERPDAHLVFTEEWGPRLRTARQRAEMSQWRLGIEAQVNPTNLSRIERGEYVPSDEVRWRLARALGLQVVDLFPYPDTNKVRLKATGANRGMAR